MDIGQMTTYHHLPPMVTYQPPSLPSTTTRKQRKKKYWTITKDDILLLNLKEKEGLAWKTIAQRFLELNRGMFRIPTLQMRYKHLKDRVLVENVKDVC